MLPLAEPRNFATLVDDVLTAPWNAEHDRFDAACVYALVPAGKLFRPVLMLSSAAAVGADPETLLVAASALEHAHAASLVHDDIVDGDPLRRGRPSVVAEYGLGKALVVGDALIFELFAALARCRFDGVPDARIVDAIAVFARAGIDMCRGQFQEDEMSGHLDCGLDAYLVMAGRKTGALCAAACEAGAVLGGAPAQWSAALAEYGRCLGVAFQIRDDLLPYRGDERRVGKKAASDARNGRMTVPVLLAHALGTAADRALLADLFRGDRSAALLAEVVERTGALERATELAHEWVARACAALDVLPGSSARAALEAVARSAVERAG